MAIQEHLVYITANRGNDLLDWHKSTLVLKQQQEMVCRLNELPTDHIFFQLDEISLNASRPSEKMLCCHRHSAVKPHSRLWKAEFQILILAIFPWYLSELSTWYTIGLGVVACDLSQDRWMGQSTHCLCQSDTGYPYHSWWQSQDLWTGEGLAACRSLNKTHTPLLINKMIKQIRWSRQAKNLVRQLHLIH